MPVDTLLRLLLALLLLGAGLALYHLVTHWLLSRARGKASQLEAFRPGQPAILYFTTPDCAVCKAVQRPALRSLQTRLGERLQVIEVDAYEKPELARDWGVMSVPTTFILDAQGEPRHMNPGVTPADKLFEQLKKAGAAV